MILIVMGVSSSGKSTIGYLLSERLGWPILDGDDFHLRANVEKMSRGIPLTDEDRYPWLDRLAELIADHLKKDQSMILACSALKQAYRTRLVVDPSKTLFIYLKGSYKLILARMSERSGHYMKPHMLVSQLSTLEEPQDALTVSIDQTPEQIVNSVVDYLKADHHEQNSKNL